MTHNLGGKPITGKISHYAGEPKNQRPPHEFVEAIDAVLARPEVEAIRWCQYTPYFNDGDACVFGACCPNLKLVGADDWTEEIYIGYPDGYWNTHYRSEAQRVHNPDLITPFDPADENVVKYYGAPKGWQSSPELDEVVATLYHAFDDEHHDVMLYEVFGDPAEVVASEDGYHIEEYVHG